MIIVYLCSVHEGHGYNEAVEDYNRAQHSSSSSPGRGYTDHLNAASPGPVNTAGAPVPNTTAATYSTAQHISTMMGTPGSPGIFQSSSSKSGFKMHGFFCCFVVLVLHEFLFNLDEQITPPQTPAPAHSGAGIRVEALKNYYQGFLQNTQHQGIKNEHAPSTPAQLASTFLQYHILSHSNASDNAYLQNTHFQQRPGMITSDEYGKMPCAETQKLQMHLMHQYQTQQHVQVPAQQVQVHEISPVSGESTASSHEEMWNQYNGGAMHEQNHQ